MDVYKKNAETINRLSEELKKPELSKETKEKKEKERDEKFNVYKGQEKEIADFRQRRQKDLQDQAVRMRNGIVQIDDDVEIGANTTIDRARFGRTWIGEGTKIDNLVMIAHNVIIGKHSVIVSQVGISGSSRIGNYVTLAGQVGLVGHIEIGDQAIVAAKSGVSKSIPAKEMWWGFPAKPVKEQKELLAYISRLPKLVERVKRLEERAKAD